MQFPCLFWLNNLCEFNCQIVNANNRISQVEQALIACSSLHSVYKHTYTHMCMHACILYIAI